MKEFDPKAPSQGVGDTIAKITHATGIAHAAEAIAQAAGKKDCGCNGRRNYLNSLFPYRQAQEGPQEGPEAQEEPAAPVMPPHPIQVLIGQINDPVFIQTRYAWAKEVHEPFPLAASPLILAHLLQLAGFVVPYAGQIDRQLEILQQFGWRVLMPDQGSPRPGDIYLTEENGELERMGFVAGVNADHPTHFMAADNVMPNHQPYRRNIKAEDGDYAPVVLWLRFMPEGSN